MGFDGPAAPEAAPFSAAAALAVLLVFPRPLLPARAISDASLCFRYADVMANCRKHVGTSGDALQKMQNREMT
jgi:hypothetical protein